MQTGHITLSHVEVTADDLPLFCPTPDMSLWQAHPRVFIPVDKTGEARCPYCSTLYKFKGDLPQGQH
ncbi:MAG: zinc-finger domain-containing protein [Sideroxydans sp.]|nr:zinc-finger domain-containing protein [Sideroxydans sp.]